MNTQIWPLPEESMRSNAATEPVGSTRTERVNVRVISATNKRLLNLAKSGEFREDLYYRLNVFPIYVPPLRERPEDIGPLVSHFVARLAAESGKRVVGISDPALDMLRAYVWPGNIRQLENAIEHAVAMSGASEEISADMLPFDIRHGAKTLASPVTIPDAGISLTSVVSQLETDLILQSLERTGGNKRQAALLLNMSRTTLIDKIQPYKLEPEPS